MPQEGIRYIKIAKKDKDGINQTNTLQSLTEITIPFSTGNITYNVISITEKPTFFLYSVPYTNVEWVDRADIEYDFTGSLVSRPTVPSEGIPNGDYVDVVIEKDSLNFWERIPRSGYTASLLNQYNIQTYPQKLINFRATGSISAMTASSDQHSIALVGVESDGSQVPLAAQSWTPASTATQSFDIHWNTGVTLSISGSTPDTKYYISILKNDPTGEPLKGYVFHGDSKFIISSSIASGPNIETIPEPYFGLNNFFKDIDCQPLFNNVDINRRHNLFMDVDYSSGITEPTNFELLISGSALRAEVQISNYSTLRHILPRYEGSKSTSQKLNTFTKGDIGTYGKSPTVESLKRMVAYCDFIGGWPPERMNASSAHIIYLIDENGDIKIPDTSENSLEDVQGTFQTGERVELNSKTIGSGISTPFRNIIRGGSRIEPVLYTQIGKVPNVLWTSSILLEDIELTSGSATANYQNNGSILGSPNYQERDRLRLSSGPFNSSLIGSSTFPNSGNSYNHYNISSGVLDENVILNLKINNLSFTKRVNQLDIGISSFQVGIILKKNDDTIGLHQETFTQDLQDQGQGGTVASLPFSFQNTSINFSIQPQNLVVGDEISIEFKLDSINLSSLDPKDMIIDGGSYSFTQTPLPTIPITIGNNNIWGYFNKSTNPSVITSSNSVSGSLGALYGDPNVKQTNITSSGFNTIVLPWSIKTGDEFRFEGEEKNVYMVKRAYGPNESGGDRLSQTGSIEVHFDKNLPISASVANFNLDHFLIRRYVDDASSIIIEGFKPTDSTGPFILTPEYSVAKLNKSIDEYITILTEKNLLS